MLNGIGYALCFICVPVALLMGIDRAVRDKDRMPAMHSGATPECPTWRKDEDKMLYFYEQRQNTLPPTYLP